MPLIIICAILAVYGIAWLDQKFNRKKWTKEEIDRLGK